MRILKSLFLFLFIGTTASFAAPRNMNQPVRTDSSHITSDERISLEFLLPMFQDLCAHSEFDHCDTNSSIIQLCEELEQQKTNITVTLVKDALTLFFNFLHERRLGFVLTPSEIKELQKLCSTVLYRQMFE